MRLSDEETSTDIKIEFPNYSGVLCYPSNIPLNLDCQSFSRDFNGITEVFGLARLLLSRLGSSRMRYWQEM